MTNQLSALLPSYYLWMVVLLPYAGALIAPLLAKAPKARNLLAVLFSFLAALFALLLLLPILQGQSLSVYDSVIPSSLPWIPEIGVNVGLLHDPYTVILANVVAWVSFLIMFYSLEYMKGEEGLTRYWFFMNFFLGSMQLIVLSDNFLSLFVGWELVGLCSYALIGFYYSDEKKYWVGTPGRSALGEEQAYPPSHAGMKAFVMTRVGDVAMLIGIILLFVYSGTFNYQQLANSTGWVLSLSRSGLLVPVALLIFGGAVGKSAQFPLHEWLPDAMAGPAPVSALIHAATMVKAGVVLVARVAPLFYFAAAASSLTVQPFFLTVSWIGAFTAFLAATQALVGFELKKILAYSTVSQIGYMMMAIGLTGLSADFAQGLSAGLYQLLSHAIFKACLFMAAGALIHLSESKYIDEMGGLRSRLKITFAAFLIAVASLSGVPPFSGFWSKDAVLAVAWNAGQTGLFALGAVTAGLTAFYSFRMLGIIFFGKESAKLVEVEVAQHGIREVSPLMWAPYVILAVGTLFIGLISAPLGVENALDSASNAYLVSLFPQLSGQAVAPPAFNVASALIALAFAAVGLSLAAAFYLARMYNPARLVGDGGVVRGIYTFLENRWYINAVYYRVFVDPAIGFAKWSIANVEDRVLSKINTGGVLLAFYLSSAGNWVDANIVDGVANGFSSTGQSLSRAARRVQTGITEQYILIFSTGLVVLLILFVFATGAYRLL
ncbi:MAG: NADH-quinone oxidoreductase subunit L [Thaumarchaeota archaeon]|nr:MAG: NADH-quinone oxidoreductase subunit L [Nitrososphaerota archaeon]